MVSWLLKLVGLVGNANEGLGVILKQGEGILTAEYRASRVCCIYLHILIKVSFQTYDLLRLFVRI